MDHAVVQRWLRQVLAGPYGPRADAVYADVDRVLIAFSSLNPRTEVYTHDDGRSQLLLELAGTVPIEYKGATYHIPCSFWIPHEYPREPPIVYVTPTATMLVRKGRHVDANGRVGGSYLDTWTRKPEACNLLGLLHACQEIFSQQPPVYAKPAAGAAAAAASGSRSPRPHQAAPASPRPQSQPQPPPPPLPAGIARPPTDSPRSSWGPAPPPLPPAAQSSSSSPAPPPAPAFTQPRTSGPPPPPVLGQPPPLPPGPATSYPAQQPYSPTSYAAQPPYSPHQPPPPPRPPSGFPPAQASTAQAQPNPAPSAAPPPPRPLNPELLNLHNTLHTRLSTTLSSLSTALSASNAQLEVLVADLERGGDAIADERVRLEAVRDVCAGRAAKVGEVVAAARAGMEEIERKERREREDVDGFVVATSLVGNQLLTLVAEDHAYEDALFQLGRALNAERIDLDRFLKQTRYLAREQFMRRALARKICDGMRWPTE